MARIRPSFTNSLAPTYLAAAPLVLALALGGCSSEAGDDGALTGGGSAAAGGPATTTGGNAAGGSGSITTPTGAGTGSGAVTPAGGMPGSGDAGSSALGGGGTGGSAVGGSATGGGGTGGTVPKPVCADGLPASVSDLAHFASDDTNSDKTPLGSRYDGVAGHVASADELAFLHDASREPNIPGSTSGLSLKALSVTLYPSSGGTPIPADINQHAIGNCDGDTAFASIAYTNPAYIQSLITDNHDGSFSVAMYNPQGEHITVSLDSKFLVDGGGNIGAVSGKNGVADWATVLEKATMKYIQVWPVVADIGGIGSEHQTPMFTGHGGSVGFDRGKLSKADLTRIVKASLAAGKLISGGFGIEGLALASGLQTVTAHGYAVLVPKNDQTMISMRNPWGLDPTDHGFDGTTDGVLDIPPDDQWAKTIDIRIIDPGDACGTGATQPYQPPSADIQQRAMSLAHARKAR